MKTWGKKAHITYGGFTCSSSTTTPGNNGNVYQISNVMNTARTQNFSYDALNRINQAYTNGATWGQQFNIYAWGNLTSVTALSGYPVIGGFTATASTSNQLSCMAGCTTCGAFATSLRKVLLRQAVYTCANRLECRGLSKTGQNASPSLSTPSRAPRK